MLQTEPEERSEVDAAIKKITREVQKGVNKFMDMLDMGDSSKYNLSESSKGLHGEFNMY